MNTKYLFTTILSIFFNCNGNVQLQFFSIKDIKLKIYRGMSDFKNHTRKKKIEKIPKLNFG